MNVQQLIGEVAKRHNVLVGPDDPIFVAVTLNELLLEEHVQKLQAALDYASGAAADASSRQVEHARLVASHLISDGARFSADQIRSAGAALRVQLERFALEAFKANRAAVAEAERHRVSSGRSAAIAMASAGLAIGLALARWMGGL
jgi:hypothetical protein